MNIRRITLLLLASCTVGTAAAQVDEIPRIGRNMPLYPGLYFDARFLHDDGDRVFDADGRERDNAIPSLPDATRFPRDEVTAEFLWHFPMFETYGLLWFSERTHFARVRLHWARTRTEGALAAFAAAEAADGDGDVDDADDLRSGGSGIGDVFVEYGGYLYGSPADRWRSGERGPLAVALAIGGNLPFGVYDRDAPVSAGSNTAFLQARLALHARPWRGGYLDAEAGFRDFYKNQDAAYMALAPRQRGDERYWSLILAQRLLPGLYLGAFASGRSGDPNQYKDLRYAPNDPPDAQPERDPSGTRNYDKLPQPGAVYHDRGLARRAAGIGLEWFPAQRWRLALYWERPLSGRSGAFDVQWVQRTPAGCTVGASGCQIDPAEVLRADGVGPARTYASERLMFGVSYQFHLRDPFSCPGCQDR